MFLLFCFNVQPSNLLLLCKKRQLVGNGTTLRDHYRFPNVLYRSRGLHVLGSPSLTPFSITHVACTDRKTCFSTNYLVMNKTHIRPKSQPIYSLPFNSSNLSTNFSHPALSSQLSLPLPMTLLTALLDLNFQSLATSSPLPAARPSVRSRGPKVS